MRILMFGRTGQVAREVQALAGIDVIALSRQDADLIDAEAIRAAIAAHGGVDLILNAAAYTAVDQAESQPDQAFAVNAAAPGVMARACAERGLPLITLSTDYVFDGLGDRPWREGDVPNPQSVYGRSKLEGEQAVLRSGARAVVLRTSWVFSPHGRNFVTTMLRLGRTQERLRVVDDQIGRPTSAADIADVVLVIARQLIAGPDAAGLYHFAGAGAVSWWQFARAIIEQAGLDTPVDPITTEDFPTPAKRPTNSVLDTSRLEHRFAYHPRPWRTGLNETLARLQEQA